MLTRRIAASGDEKAWGSDDEIELHKIVPAGGTDHYSKSANLRPNLIFQRVLKELFAN